MGVFAEDEVFEARAEGGRGEVALEAAVGAEADLAGFFGDDDADGVGVFGEAEACAVAEAEVALEVFALAEGEDAAGGDDAGAAEDDAAVMEDGFGVEEGEEEFGGEAGVNFDTGLCNLAEGDAAFEGDECAEALAGKLEDGVAEGVEGFGLAAVAAEPGVGPEFAEGAAELRLEDYDESEGEEDGEAAQHPADDGEVEELADEGEG